MSKINDFLERLEIPADALSNAKEYLVLTDLFDKVYGYKFSIKRKDKRKKEIVLSVTLGKEIYDISDIESYQNLFQMQFSFDQVETKEDLENLCWNFVQLKMKWMNAKNKLMIQTMFPGLEEFYGLFRAVQKTPHKKDPFYQYDLNQITFTSLNEYLFELVAESNQKKIEVEEERVRLLKEQKEAYEKEMEEQRLRNKFLEAEPIYLRGKQEVDEMTQQKEYNQMKLVGLRGEQREYEKTRDFGNQWKDDLAQRNFLIRIWKYRARKKWEEMIAHAVLEINRVKEEINSLRIENKDLECQLKYKIRQIEKEMDTCKFYEYEKKLSYYKNLEEKDVSVELEEVNTLIAGSNLNKLLNDLKALYEKNQQYLNLAPMEEEKEKNYQYCLKENA